MFCVGLASAKNILRYSLEDARDHFENFIQTYNKEYDEEERAVRYEIFVKNLEKINSLNENSDGAVFGINKFSDLTSEEFVQRHTGYVSSNVSGICINSNDLNLKPVDVPEEFDWRQKRVVTAVKNQIHCGSCWAFSAIGTVESAYAIKTNQLVDLSEQELIDCDKKSYGCRFGNPETALKYIQDNGATTEEVYPYEARDGMCRLNPQKVKVRVKNCVTVQAKEDEFAEKLLQLGPLSIAVDGEVVKHYLGGILKECKGRSVNHAVLLVGYGKGEDGKPYWLVKNSWGADWGENGYFRMPRGVNCVFVANTAPLGVVIA